MASSESSTLPPQRPVSSFAASSSNSSRPSFSLFPFSHNAHPEWPAFVARTDTSMHAAAVGQAHHGDHGQGHGTLPHQHHHKHQRAATQPVLPTSLDHKRSASTTSRGRRSSSNHHRLSVFFSSLKTKQSPPWSPPPDLPTRSPPPPLPDHAAALQQAASIHRKPLPAHPPAEQQQQPPSSSSSSIRRPATFHADAFQLDFTPPNLPPPLHSPLHPPPQPPSMTGIERRASDSLAVGAAAAPVRNFSHKSRPSELSLAAPQAPPPPPPPPPPPKDSGEDDRARTRKLQPRTRRVSPSPEPPRGRSPSVHSPAPGKLTKTRTHSAQPNSRSTPEPAPSRPDSYQSGEGQAQPPPHPQIQGHHRTNSHSRERLQKSWRGSRPRDVSGTGSGEQKPQSTAWIINPDGTAEYSTNFLTMAENVPELWNEAGDVLIYLFPRESDLGPSFKVSGGILNDSAVFAQLLQTDSGQPSPVSGRTRTSSFSGRTSLTAEDARRIVSDSSNTPYGAPSRELRLYLAESPTVGPSTSIPSPERLIDLRNLIAFLTGQPLVATRVFPDLYQILLRIARLLEEFAFSSPDNFSFGKAVDLSFEFYCEQFTLADLRFSREKTIEALMLGEQMRSWDLYNEAFVHAVGKYEALVDLNSTNFKQLSFTTKSRLERASIDLRSRQDNFSSRLEDMAFPAVFSGIASSTSNPAFRNVRFKNWKSSFGNMRNFVLKYYKHLFGSWPPRARSKKNPFTESGLNRQVLRQLYADMCALYDLLVDREQVTTRTFNQISHDEPAAPSEANVVALRRILDEYDNSSPPVLPPVPFDVPRIPTMKTIRETYDDLLPKEQAQIDKRLQSYELILIMRKSYDFDTDSLKHPFLEAFKEWDLSHARGKSSQDLADMRYGIWVFLYVIIQSLPMLAVDAPGLRHTEGTEYFLCMAPRGDPPWLEDASEVRKMWFTLAGQDKKVELNADAVLFSVEATYDRSHCWIMAKRWAEGIDSSSPHQMLPPLMSPLEPPRPTFSGMEPCGADSPTMGTGTPASASPTASGFGSPMLRPRNQSPGKSDRRSTYIRASVLGLEPVDYDPPPGMPGLGAGSPYSGSNRSLLNLSGPPSAGMPPAAPEFEPPSAPFSQSQRGHVGRSQSAGNLKLMLNHPGHAGGAAHQRTGSVAVAAASPPTGMSFDDILKGMDDKKANIKKKKSWLPV